MNLITITIDADREVVVPREPTAEMCRAGVEAGVAAHTGWCPPTYRAMLEAAPKRQQAAMDERVEFEKWYVKRFNYAGKFPIDLTPRDECRFEGFIAGFQARASLGHELTGVGE